MLVYGHDGGLSLAWRGGRRLKKESPASNGAKDDTVMIAEFEDESSTTESSLPEVIQTLDLSLGTAALHLAVLPITLCSADDTDWSYPELLREKIVLGVTCATGDVYVLTIPLTPPSHASKSRLELRKDFLAGTAGNGTWGETVTLLCGSSKPSNGIAITLVRQRASTGRSRSVDRAGLIASPPTRIIVAAHSREANGTLRLWDVPLDATPGKSSSVGPFQTEYVRSSLAGLAFNPTQPTQLLVIAPSQAVRIFDYSVPSVPSDDASEGPFPTQGSWLVSLYAPFHRRPGVMTSRRPIVDASWVSHGRAILTLLADGQWGIWDLEGASPLTNAATDLFGQHGRGVRGSAITTFSATGYLEGTSPLRNPGSQKGTSVSGGDFEPMTPHTRRDALAASMAGGPEKLSAVRGGVEVTQLPLPHGKNATTSPEEAAVLWLGGADPVVSIITGISRFWDAQLRRGTGGGVNLFSGAQPTRMIRLLDLSAGLLGERCTGAAAIPRFKQPFKQPRRVDSGTEPSPSTSDGLPIEVLLQGESRLVFVHESEDPSALSMRLVATRKNPRRPGDRVASAIIAYPRPEKPNSVAFNLSVRSAPGRRRTGSAAFAPRPGSSAGLISKPATADVGLLFATDLGAAADIADEETKDVGARNVEEEIMDIMEIDRELEMLDSERDAGTKHVFFENG